MNFLKLKRFFSNKIEKKPHSPRLIFNLNHKRQFNIFDLRRLYYGYLFIRKNNGTLILQNREHQSQKVKIKKSFF